MNITKKATNKIFLYICLVVLAIIWLCPVLTVFITALKSRQDFFSGLGLFEMPKKLAWNNFPDSLRVGNLFIYMKNGLIVSCLKVPLGIFVEAMAAFMLTRLNIKHRTGWFVFFLVGMMLPMQVALVPINVIFSKLNLINTYFGLFYVYVGFGISFGILVLRGFFKTIPKEIDEAALIDGCGKWRLFINIILPTAKPALATLLILDFLATWNEYLLASVLVNQNAKKTVAAGLMAFVGERGTDYGLLMAGVLMSIIPILIVYLFFQRYFVEGIAGAVKG